MERINIVTLGCSKNTVDSENMLGLLKDDYILTSNINECDIVIINTCAFINDAKEESIEKIFEVINLKKEGIIKKIVVAGCLSQRYAEELYKEIPEVDLFIGTSNYDKILEIIKEENERTFKIEDASRDIPSNLPRVVTDIHHYSFVKISEGCDNLCTYCVIPKIRGKYRSRKMEDILSEIEMLVDKGIREIIIIAQDTSKYGTDIYGEKKLHELLHKISQIDLVKWVRVHYIYPEDFYEELLQEFENDDKLLNYFEIPLQHINDEILKKMNRKTTKKEIIELLNKIRTRISNAIIRTTFIVGFPGETQRQFDELKSFIKEFEFDRLGVFEYSEEEDTPAAKMPNKIDEEVKAERRNELMEIQLSISIIKNEKLVSTCLDAIIDEKIEENQYIGRTYMDSPEIDGSIYVNSNVNLEIGSIVSVEITDSTEYDLIGEYYEFTK